MYILVPYTLASSGESHGLDLLVDLNPISILVKHQGKQKRFLAFGKHARWTISQILRVSLIWNYQRSQISNIIVIHGVIIEFFSKGENIST